MASKKSDLAPAGPKRDAGSAGDQPSAAESSKASQIVRIVDMSKPPRIVGTADLSRPAKDRPAMSQTAEAVKPGLKAVRLELTPEQQQKLRVVAAQSNMSMAAFARSIVLAAIQEES